MLFDAPQEELTDAEVAAVLRQTMASAGRLPAARRRMARRDLRRASGGRTEGGRVDRGAADALEIAFVKKNGSSYPLPPLRPKHGPRSRYPVACLMPKLPNLFGAQLRAPEGATEIIAVKHTFKPRQHH